MKKISIIIVTYNSTKHIYDCLDSIFVFNDIGEDLEVIVVDNASEEKQSMFNGISSKYGRRVLLLDSGRNGGYGAGNNYGINIATSPIVTVMNPDVRLVQPIFREILKEMEDKSVGMLGVSFVDGSLPFYMRPELISTWNQLIHPIRVKMKLYNENTMYMSGSFLTFRKEAFIKAGVFDENLFMYCEEPDITKRIKLLGYHAIWCSRIKVKHLAHGRNFNKRVEEIKRDSLKYYFKKYNCSLVDNIKVKIRILKTKRIVAKITNNKRIFDLFNNQLQSHHNFLDSIKGKTV